MKILHLLASNKYSGAENVVCQIIKMFESEVEMVYCSPVGEIENALKEKNVPYLPIASLNKKEVKKVVEEFMHMTLGLVLLQVHLQNRLR